jgi:hypothetical protein
MVKEQMTFRCQHASLIGTGHIERARLEFYLHATVRRSRIRKDAVPVAVWEISEADEQRLDRYEGFPSYYIKAEWPVRMSDGTRLTGMIYLMKLIRTAPPTVSYYNGIFDAYNKLGLGSEIETVLEPALRRAFARDKAVR